MNLYDKQKSDNVSLNRNYGIDLLKIISMIMIVTLHIIGQGGIIRNTYRLSDVYNAAWLIESFCYCCVNCYALSSGFVMYNRKFKYTNIVNLYLQTSFYMLITTVIFGIYDPECVGIKEIVRVIFPFAYNEYWYFTAYIGMAFFIPCLNLIVEKFSKKQTAKLILVSFFLFSLCPIIFDVDVFKMRRGYSMFWLSLMYVLGAYIKKYNIAFKIKKRFEILFYILLSLLSFVIRSIFIIWQKENGYIEGLELSGTYIIDYCSPFTVIASVAVFMFFVQLKFKSTGIKIISFFAPLTFGVYLIHVNPFIWKMLKDLFVEFAYMTPLFMSISVILTAIIVFVLCAFIDKIRLMLFKIFKIKKLSEEITEKISYCINKILDI